ncbi:MAG: UDP-3-O-acyl-N-acetylglucosamine deacetylase, partial [bacterium]
NITILPAAEFRIAYFMHYEHPMLRNLTFDFQPDAESFSRQVAPARTFALYEEVKGILEKGLAKGGSVENAVVFYEDSTSSPLRFPDEPARHKVLDIMGDLSLLGRRLRGRIVAVRSGHALNQSLVRKIAEEYPG